MKLVERHVISKGHHLFNQCDQVSFLAKNLYNRANYLIRQHFFETGEYLTYQQINRMMVDSGDRDYTALPRKVSNNILQLVDRNWKSFFALIKKYKEGKLNHRPKIPKYKDSQSGRVVVPFEKGALLKQPMKIHGKLGFSRTDILINTQVSWDEIQAARIVPHADHYTIEIVYNKQEEPVNEASNHILAIDLGVNNLIAGCSTSGDCFLVNGRPLKSINQFYNKRKAQLQSMLPSGRKTSKRITRMTNKRNNKVRDYLHKATRQVVEYCLTHNVGKIVVGKNDNWKTRCNIGRGNNQTFVSIPHNVLIEQLQYKCKLAGIEFEVINESYTSKCSAFDQEDICRHKQYVGKRIKRGLFRTANRWFVNADINAAANILRKAITRPLGEVIEGFAVNPSLIPINVN